MKNLTFFSHCSSTPLQDTASTKQIRASFTQFRTFPLKLLNNSSKYESIRLRGWWPLKYTRFYWDPGSVPGFLGGLTLSQPDHVDKFEGPRFEFRPGKRNNK